MIATIISSILATLFAGCNILQLVNNKQLRRQLSAQADQEQNKSWEQIVSGQTAEIARLQTAYGELQNKYFSLAEEMQVVKSQLAGMTSPSITRKKSPKN